MPAIQGNVSKKLDGERLDLAAVAIFAASGWSRRAIRRVIDTGGAYVNAARVRVASRPVRAGDKITLQFTDEVGADGRKRQTRPRIELSRAHIIYSDANVIILNKPAHLPSQPTRDQAVNHVLAALKPLAPDIGVKVTSAASLAHRLDSETTGIIAVALNAERCAFLMEQFKARTVEKCYHAVCWGQPDKPTFREVCHLSPIHGDTGMVQVVKSGGKIAETDFSLMAHSPDRRFSLMRCEPHTGRSHQLRVHLAKNRLPIVGDKKYGSAALGAERLPVAPDHQLLHARELTLTIEPGGEPRTFTAPYPAIFEQFIADFKEA